MVSFARERGAVHILFLIGVLMVALAFAGLWFTEQQQNEDLRVARDRFRAEKEIAERRVVFAEDAWRETIRQVGAGLPEAIPFPTEGEDISGVEAMQLHVTRIKNELQSIPGLVNSPSAAAGTIRAAWDPILEALRQREQVITQKDTEIARLRAELQNKDNQISSAQTAFEEERTRTRQDNETTVSRLNTQLNEVRAQNDTFSTRTRELQEEMDRAKDEANREVQSMRVKTTEFEGQVQSMKRGLDLERRTETPDGSVLSADPESGLVFIDVGARHQLPPGTRFKVYETGKGQTKIEKGWLVVTDVRSDMSVARIDSQVPGTGGISSGDWLYNPYYQRNGKTRFAFLGQFGGRYSRETAERVLKNAGAMVDPAVTVHTDFLVLGEKEDPDAEELTEHQDYKNAITWGVQILRARDLEAFIKF